MSDKGVRRSVAQTGDFNGALNRLGPQTENYFELPRRPPSNPEGTAHGNSSGAFNPVAQAPAPVSITHYGSNSITSHGMPTAPIVPAQPSGTATQHQPIPSGEYQAFPPPASNSSSGHYFSMPESKPASPSLSRNQNQTTPNNLPSSSGHYISLPTDLNQKPMPASSSGLNQNQKPSPGQVKSRKIIGNPALPSSPLGHIDQSSSHYIALDQVTPPSNPKVPPPSSSSQCSVLPNKPDEPIVPASDSNEKESRYVAFKALPGAGSTSPSPPKAQLAAPPRAESGPALQSDSSTTYLYLPPKNVTISKEKDKEKEKGKDKKKETEKPTDISEISGVAIFGSSLSSVGASLSKTLIQDEDKKSKKNKKK